jgi:hypothetical protein
MPTMTRFPAGTVALITLLAAVCGACSREQQDWRSAEAADTSEAYGRFLEQHGDSELASPARARIAQLAEQRDWAHTTRLATVDAYRQFLAHHPTGRWAEEARIRLEASALGSAPRIAPQTPEEAAVAPTGVRALQLATGAVAVPAVKQPDEPASGSPLAQPGELAQSPAAARPGEVAMAGVTSPAAAVAQPGEAAQSADAAPTVATAVPVAMSHAPAQVGADGYGVQLGAFGSPASADREWQRLQGRFGAQLGGLSPRIVPASTAAGQLYRLQVAAAGEAQARAICDTLKEQSQACVPVLPR